MQDNKKDKNMKYDQYVCSQWLKNGLTENTNFEQEKNMNGQEHYKGKG